MANQKEITAGFKGKRKPDNPFKTLGRIFSYYKNCRWMFIVAVIAILLYSASTIGASFMMKPLVASPRPRRCWRRPASSRRSSTQGTSP